MKIESSELSLQLWREALNYLKRNKIEVFLKTLAELRIEQCKQFITAKKDESLDNSEEYYTALCTHHGINDTNITDFMSQRVYRHYNAIKKYVLFKNFNAHEEINDDGINTERSTQLLKIMTIRRAVMFFLPQTNNIELQKTELSKKEKAIINKAIDSHAQIASATPLTERQVQTLLEELNILANRLANKYKHSWFKFLNKDIKEKFIILTSLRANIHKQHSITKNLTVIQANDLLKQAEKSVLAKHRNHLCRLFSKKPTRTVAGIRRCRQGIYRGQARKTSDTIMKVMSQ